MSVSLGGMEGGTEDRNREPDGHEKERPDEMKKENGGVSSSECHGHLTLRKKLRGKHPSSFLFFIAVFTLKSSKNKTKNLRKTRKKQTRQKTKKFFVWKFSIFGIVFQFRDQNVPNKWALCWPSHSSVG